ncbi:MAG: PRC-barrel domain-containing protein [bacterium]|nr:PRC-barrel domain-containing protein [bacterium]
MRMAWNQLKNLSVVTQSGTLLGQVVGFIFDPESHALVQYEVRHGSPLARKILLVATSQVIGITVERMTVEDSVTSVTNAESQRSPAAEPTLTSLASVRKD